MPGQCSECRLNIPQYLIESMTVRGDHGPAVRPAAGKFRGAYINSSGVVIGQRPTQGDEKHLLSGNCS